MSLGDDRWLFDGDAWSDTMLAEDIAALKGCGDPDCSCQDDDQADDDDPDYSRVTMTEVYDD